MAKDFLTDEQVEMEIDRLLHSEAVHLAKKEVRIKYKRTGSICTHFATWKSVASS